MGFFRRKPREQEHRIPDGERVYAVGDIHGRFDLLEAMLRAIDADDAARPPADTTLIFLGDLVDRGPQSREVVARVKALCRTTRTRLLKGNHEEIFIDAARGDKAAARALVKIGGMATILSYGVSEEAANEGSFADLASLLEREIPRDDIAFLDSAEDMIRIGGYVFVHAGIRPGVEFEEQDPRELRWLREAFTGSGRDHGAMVVHGHSICRAVEAKPNRVGVDTGAFASGRLSAVGLEGGERWFIEVTGDPDPQWDLSGIA